VFFVFTLIALVYMSILETGKRIAVERSLSNTNMKFQTFNYGRQVFSLLGLISQY